MERLEKLGKVITSAENVTFAIVNSEYRDIVNSVSVYKFDVDDLCITVGFDNSDREIQIAIHLIEEVIYSESTIKIIMRSGTKFCFEFF